MGCQVEWNGAGKVFGTQVSMKVSIQILSIYVKSQAVQFDPVIPLLGKQRQENPWGMLSTLYKGISKLRVQWDTLSQKLGVESNRRRPLVHLWPLHSCVHAYLPHLLHAQSSLAKTWGSFISFNIVYLLRLLMPCHMLIETVGDAYVAVECRGVVTCVGERSEWIPETGIHLSQGLRQCWCGRMNALCISESLSCSKTLKGCWWPRRHCCVPWEVLKHLQKLLIDISYTNPAPTVVLTQGPIAVLLLKSAQWLPVSSKASTSKMIKHPQRLRASSPPRPVLTCVRTWGVLKPGLFVWSELEVGRSVLQVLSLTSV